MNVLRWFFFFMLAMIVIASCNTASQQNRWEKAGATVVQVQVLASDG